MNQRNHPDRSACRGHNRAGAPGDPRRPSSGRGRWKKSELILVAVFLAGLSLLLYPFVSDLVNQATQSSVISGYRQTVEQMDTDSLDQLLSQAAAYNRELAEEGNDWFFDQEQTRQYNSLLDPFGTGMMGYLEIPSIQVRLPIYHGTDAAILQTGIGHLAGSSLPVGGEGSHCVLTGHRGLPSARLLTDLDQMETGDLFYLQVLNETLAYTVDDIQVVEPRQLESLVIEPGKDYCTLVTCTPYGVNTHRLLVRGVRTAYTPSPSQETVASPAAVQGDPWELLPVWVAAALAALLIVLLVWDHKNNRKER